MAAPSLEGCELIAAALSAIPLIAQAGQGLINSVGQEVGSFLGVGQSGQNVPGSAGSGAAGSPPSGGASPITVSSVAHGLSSDVMGVLNRAQGDLSAASSFASGQSGISKSQFESAAQTIAGALGQNPNAATAAAGQVFDAVNTSAGGEVTSAQLGGYLGQLQSQASASYQAASSLVSHLAGQTSTLGQTSTIA
jgi:hypothetical protein